MTRPRLDVDAIVLSGGSSSRLGRDKLTERVGQRPLLGRVTDALVEIDRVIVVGSPDGAGRVDRVCLEQPPGGGPLAGIAAGLAEVGASRVLTLAGDLPFLTPPAVRALLDALDFGCADVAMAVDEDDRDQYLLAAWDSAALRRAVAQVAPATGARLGRLYRTAGLRVVRVGLEGDPPPWSDCDTEADLAHARSRSTDG